MPGVSDPTIWQAILILVLISSIFLLVPFLVPLLTSLILGLVLRMGILSALRWGVAFGVLAIPGVSALAWYWPNWPGWFAGLAISIAWTTAFLWWWARRNRAVPEGRRPFAAG